MYYFQIVMSLFHMIIHNVLITNWMLNRDKLSTSYTANTVIGLDSTQEGFIPYLYYISYKNLNSAYRKFYSGTHI